MEGKELRHYHSSLEYLYGLQKYGIKFGLNCTQKLLEKLGNPQDHLNCIHVAGTNGKGSTAAMLSSILTRHGYRVGLYTSPHLVRFTERFRINDLEVSPERILSIIDRVREVLDEREPPTYFEMVTAMAFLYFAEEGVDWAIVEVGLGGRLDATNVIQPKACVITNVAFDHQEFLGTSLADIAREKAGIVKERVPVVSAIRQPMAQAVLKATCIKHSAPLHLFSRDFRVKGLENGTFQYKGLNRDWLSLPLNLPGQHQACNASLALATLEVLERRKHLFLDSTAIRNGLLRVHWPARLEVLQRDPLMILDGAHNPDGAERLRDALQRHFSYRRLHLVLGIMADKDIQGIMKKLLPKAETIILTRPRYSRAADPKELEQVARSYSRNVHVIPDVASAIEMAGRIAAPEDCICIAGSLYFAGEVKEIFGEPAL